MAPFSCANSGDCCRFAQTGRQPYLTQLEIEALRPWQGRAPSKRLPQVGDCVFLDDAGRCKVYASRPFGCRTFFCDNREGPKRFPRDDVNRMARELAELSQRHYPEARETRPIGRVFSR